MIETLIGGALVFVGVVTGMFAIRFQPRKVEKPVENVVNYTDYTSRAASTINDFRDRMGMPPAVDSSGSDAILSMTLERERINEFISKKMIKIHELLLSSRDDLPSAVAEEIDDLVVEVIDFLSPKGEV